MKRTTTPRHTYDPAEHPAPLVPDAAIISGLADLVMAGKIVSASLSDGTYVALMAELNQRGYELTVRTEIEKQAAPWLLVVSPVAIILPEPISV